MISADGPCYVASRPSVAMLTTSPQHPSSSAKLARVSFPSFSPTLPLTEVLVSVFIAEITARAFIVADSNKRRTLSRSDIAKALSKSDQFDFLIDIIPREDGLPGARRHHHAASGTSAAGTGSIPSTSGIKRDEVSVSPILS